MQLSLVAVICLFYVAARFSLFFSAHSFAVLWPSNGFYIAYMLQSPPNKRYRPRVLLSLYLSAVTGISSAYPLYFCAKLASINLISIPVSVWLTQTLIDRFGNESSQVNMHNVRHAGLVFGGILVSPVIAVTLAHFLFFSMSGTMFIMWLCSEFLGSLLVVPVVLLLDELPTLLRQWRAFWAYLVLIAINFMYIGLRLLGAGDASLGVFLTFPWLLLMAHMFGAAGTYMGCLVAGCINAYTAAYLDDIDRILWLHGHIVVLVFTCAGFIEIFRQRDQAQTHVERIVEQKTAKLTMALDQLVKAENKAVAALQSHTRFMRQLCHELKNPLHQVLNIASTIKELPHNDPEAEGALQTVVHASSYMASFLNDVLEMRNLEQEPDSLPCGETYISVGAAATIVSGLKSASVNVNTQYAATTERDGKPLQIPLTHQHFRILVQRLLSHVQASSIDQQATLSFWASNRTYQLQTFRLGALNTVDDLKELVMPFSTRPKTSWLPEYAGSGLSLSMVAMIVKQAGGRVHLKSIVKENRIVITITLPVYGQPLPPGDSVQVELDALSPEPPRYCQPDLLKPRSPLPPPALDDNPPQRATNQPTNHDPTGTNSILVVDDSIINRKILTRLFQILKFKIFEACDGRDAVQKYVQHSKSISMITMDINMPVMDGLEATRTLRKLGCEVPIVAVTGNLVDDVEEYRTAGVTEIAPKPFLKAHAVDLMMRYHLLK
ncbi:hypothetical protein HK102_010747 [Quaeritorhiza haematococci]|nr:hypothetical protein HK102_010747 [Quaeritorhiza haematococci]